MTDVREGPGSNGRDGWIEPGQDLDDVLARWGWEQTGPFRRSGGRHAADEPGPPPVRSDHPSWPAGNQPSRFGAAGQATSWPDRAVPSAADGAPRRSRHSADPAAWSDPAVPPTGGGTSWSGAEERPARRSRREPPSSTYAEELPVTPEPSEVYDLRAPDEDSIELALELADYCDLETVTGTLTRRRTGEIPFDDWKAAVEELEPCIRWQD